MSLEITEDRHIHFPRNLDLFQFDDEVTSIFDSMALRSIPMYAEVHRLHAHMFRDTFQPGAVVADVGASTGAFFRAIEEATGARMAGLGLEAHAVDLSHHMVARVAADFPTVRARVGDLTAMPDLPRKADAIACLFVLQFIHPDERSKAIAWLARNLAPNGVLFLGQKDDVSGAVDPLYTSEYHHFRRTNGYTQEEIDIKTRALAGSMWPATHEDFVAALAEHGLQYKESTRWLQFSSGVCTHRR